MSRKLRVALLALGGLVAFLLLVMAAVLLFMDVNAYKPRLEAAASDALGMEVRVGGRLGIGFFPGFHVALEDVRIRNRGTELASAAKAAVGIELLPLLRKEVRIARIGLESPRISIERDRAGRYSFERAEAKKPKPEEEKEKTLPSVDVAKVSVSDGAVVYEDSISGEGLAAAGVDLKVGRLRLLAGKSSDLLKNLSFSATLACRELRKGSLAVSDLKVRIEGKNGVYEIRPVTVARLVYAGPDGTVTADRLDLGVKELAIGGEGQGALLPRMVFEGNAEIGEIRTKDLVVSGVNVSAVGKDGVIDVKPVTMRIFGGQGSGNIRMDLSGPVPSYDVRYSLRKFRFEEFLKSLSPKKSAEGPMDFSASLSFRGKSAKEMKRTANGEVSLRGENLTFEGIDLDRMLSRYESSQSFNLVDVGAFFFAGPIGPAVTKGYGFASVFQEAGGRSRIRVLVSDWKVERGVAHSKDVAMATNANRIALKGRLDFGSERFDDVTVALVDAKGCAKFSQKIRGPFGKPEVEKVNFIQSLAGPALKLFKQTRDLFPGGRCDMFYAGSVAPPK